MARVSIRVSRLGSAEPAEFEAVVREGESESRHRVTVAESDFERLAGGRADPERLVEAAFRFLLEREPKESILSSFDLTVIPRYFPEFEGELPRYLAS